ncbi:AfsR/SARP family transcriptional regulator [Xylanimonas ulmi]|uniref:DNA-binding SARP family transcriptional activator n=1 Tax=Xylanimonas ulmi TaxID=228973 RepID=A0A4Q7M332_9MICO|nr:BTAD domain-containing putative transcriptional regulator [Xylanibacterium ulmi]RZS61914.1 DNA-binding SARP family transcriptional activator [Xylanibacterium ulmi]
MPASAETAAPASAVGLHDDRVALLGDVGVTRDGLAVPLQRRERLLVALLALQGPRARAHIAGTLWPDSCEERARASLRQSLRTLRRAEGFVAGTESLGLDPGVSVDVWALRARCAEVLSGSPLTARRAVAAVRAIVGPELLLGEFDEWVEHERRRLQRLRLHALEHLARQCGQRGEHTWAVTAAEAAADIDPLREEPTMLLIGLHLAEGSAVEARRVFDEYRRRLRVELHVEPSPRVREALRAAGPA